MVRATGRSAEQIGKDIDRDFYMGAEQARDYGLIDEVFLPKKKTTP